MHSFRTSVLYYRRTVLSLSPVTFSSFVSLCSTRCILVLVSGCVYSQYWEVLGKDQLELLLGGVPFLRFNDPYHVAFVSFRSSAVHSCLHIWIYLIQQVRLPMTTKARSKNLEAPSRRSGSRYFFMQAPTKQVKHLLKTRSIYILFARWSLL